MVSFGISLQTALKTVARDFKNSGKLVAGTNVIVSGITNYYTNKKDEQSKKIEAELYFAFNSQFPEVKLVDISESVTGVSSRNSVFVKGHFQQKGNIATLYIKAFKGTLDGELLHQAVVDFETEHRQKSLVAVLDIEAKFLTLDQRKIFSDIFREALGDTGVFDMASSADIDKMNPDEIQVATGCTRDSCATIIGEQLGVDRVISTTARKLNDKTFYFSGKLMDIGDGSIVTAKTVKHTGGIETFDSALQELAEKLTSDLVKPEPTSAPTPAVAAPVATPRAPVEESNFFVYDEETGLYWQKDESDAKPWSEAIAYCQQLNLANQSDWRLPDKKEMESSFRINDRFPDLVNSYYWTSTTNKEYNYYAWGMTASTGYLFSDGNKTSYYYVRCVRGEKLPDKQTVVDQSTGLEWQRMEAGEFDWKRAVDYCDRLELDGRDDWRLPNKNELTSSNNIRDSFPDISDGYYWSSTTNPTYKDYAWGGYASNGTLFDNGYKPDYYNIRCVRGQSENASVVVYDEKTGLTWQTEEAGQYSWSDGIEFCNKLTLDNKSDWRLPNKEELETSYLIQDKFPYLVNGYYWSSSEKNTIWAWGLTTSTGQLFSNGTKIRAFNIRCVRGAMN